MLLYRLRRLAVGAIIASFAFSGAAHAGQILDTATKKYSQHDEEVIIRDFFNDRKGGFFVDIGAFTPKEFSTTYYLESELGWTGIAVDALPNLAASWKAERPRTKFFQNAVSDKSGEKMTFYLSGQLSSLDPEWLRQFPKIPKEKEGIPFEVTSITMNDLLEQNNVTKIDFLSMDIEGSEPAALSGFDIDKYKPELICIEISPSVREKILDYLTAHGYERIEEYVKRDPKNGYFRRAAGKKDAAAAAPAKAGTAPKAAPKAP
jgi:FkbM family methyltransferase